MNHVKNIVRVIIFCHNLVCLLQLSQQILEVIFIAFGTRVRKYGNGGKDDNQSIRGREVWRHGEHQFVATKSEIYLSTTRFAQGVAREKVKSYDG